MSIGCVASFINPSARVPASQLCTLYWQLCGLGVRFAAVLLKLHDYVHKDTFDTLKDETVSESTRRLSRGDCHGDCVCDDLRTVHMIVIEAKGGDLHGSNDTRTPRTTRAATRDTSFDGIVASGGEEVSSTGAPTPCTLNACSTRAQAIIFYTTFLRAYISIAYTL